VLTVPALFIESFQTAEDYYSRAFFSSVIRLVRYIAFFLTLLAPAIYISIITFHPEIVPTPLLLTLAASMEGLPFPTYMEVGLMLLTFEILREAGVRLPRPVGQAISIVGALVIGEAAVRAGIVADFTVILVGITAVSSFVVPPQTDSVSILRIIFFFLGVFIGGYGLIIGIIGLMIHLTTLRSFGVPFLSPLAPLSISGEKDMVLRAPLWAMDRRPEHIAGADQKRQAPGSKPSVKKRGKTGKQ